MSTPRPPRKALILLVTVVLAGFPVTVAVAWLRVFVDGDTPSKVIGTVAHGRIEHAHVIPPSGPGFVTYSFLGSAVEWECGATGVVRAGAATPARAARAPVVRSGGRGGGLDDAPWSEDAAKGAVRLQVGMVFDPEGERQLVTHFLRERDPEVRRQFLAAREREGRLTCDACDVDLGAEYGRIFSHVVEVHHEIPIARGERDTKLESLRLLCPTCHRVVHYRQPEPRKVEEVKRLVNRAR